MDVIKVNLKNSARSSGKIFSLYLHADVNALLWFKFFALRNLVANNEKVDVGLLKTKPDGGAAA